MKESVAPSDVGPYKQPGRRPMAAPPANAEAHRLCSALPGQGPSAFPHAPELLDLHLLDQEVGHDVHLLGVDPLLKEAHQQRHKWVALLGMVIGNGGGAHTVEECRHLRREGRAHAYTHMRMRGPLTLTCLLCLLVHCPTSFLTRSTTVCHSASSAGDSAPALAEGWLARTSGRSTSASISHSAWCTCGHGGAAQSGSSGAGARCKQVRAHALARAPGTF